MDNFQDALLVSEPLTQHADIDIDRLATASEIQCKSEHGKQPLSAIKQTVRNSIFNDRDLTEPACLQPLNITTSVTSINGTSSQEFGSFIETKNRHQLECGEMHKDRSMSTITPTNNSFGLKREPFNTSDMYSEHQSTPHIKDSGQTLKINNLQTNSQKSGLETEFQLPAVHNDGNNIGKGGNSENIFHMTVKVDDYTIEVNEVVTEPSASAQENLSQETSASKAQCYETEDALKSSQVSTKVASSEAPVQHSLTPQVAADIILKRPNPEDVKRNLRKVLETGDPYYQFKKRNIDIVCSVFETLACNDEYNVDNCYSNGSEGNVILMPNPSLQSQSICTVTDNNALIFDGEEIVNIDCNTSDTVNRPSKPTIHLISDHKQFARNYRPNKNIIANSIIKNCSQSATALDNQQHEVASNILEVTADYYILNSSAIDYKTSSESTTIDLDLLKTKSLFPESPVPVYSKRLKAVKVGIGPKAAVKMPANDGVLRVEKQVCKSKTSGKDPFKISKESSGDSFGLKLDIDSQSCKGKRSRKQTQSKANISSSPSFSGSETLQNPKSHTTRPAKRPKLQKSTTDNSTEITIKTNNAKNRGSCSTELLLSYSRTIESVVSASHTSNDALIKGEPNQENPENINCTYDDNIKSEILDLNDIIID